MKREVLFLHGFTQTGSAWHPTTCLLGETYRFHTPDIRGHGAKSAVRPIGFTECINDVLAVVEGKFTLVGYSMGGRIALLTALAAPQRIERLMLIGATAGIEDSKMRAERKQRDLALAERLEQQLTIEQFAQEWGQLPLFTGQTGAVAELARSERLKNTTAGLAAALRGISTGTMEPVWDRLGELTMPVDLVVGAQDQKFVGVAKRMVQALPEGRVVEVPDTGHAVALERPEVVAELLQG